MEIVGFRETVPVPKGLAPELAVQTKGPELPLTDKVANCPLQMMVLVGVILIVKAGVTETVATAEDVHVPAPETNV